MKFASTCFLALAANFLIGNANALSGEIPAWTINDPILGWTPITYVSVAGGDQNVPVLIDSGSSLIALCNTTEFGDIAQPTDSYGCGAYGTTPNGWVGEFYDAALTIGDIKDPQNVSLVLMDTQNSMLCTPYVHGILGVDLGTNAVFDEPQVLPSPETCSYTSNATLPFCCNNGNATGLESQFGESMLTDKDLYTFGLIGLGPGRNSTNSTKSVMAFGETAREYVEDSVSTGTASFASSESTWYTFANNVSWALTGVESNCTQYTGTEDCSFSLGGVFIDSGTQQLVLPFDDFPDNFTSLVITVEDVELELTYDDMALLNEVGGLAFGGPASGVLGFPIFWLYDVVFDVNMDKIDTLGRYGDVSFYERAAALQDDDDEVDEGDADDDEKEDDESAAVERTANSNVGKEVQDVKENDDGAEPSVATPEMNEEPGATTLESIITTATSGAVSHSSVALSALGGILFSILG